MNARATIKLLLINPRFPESFWSFKWVTDSILPNKRTINPPLGLATLAGLTPEHWDIKIIDENIESMPVEFDADIVGICGMGVQFKRQKELINYYKEQGHYVVAGGSFASLCPEHYTSLADTVISGEAEYIWKAFCQDYERGKPHNLYQEKGEVDLTDSPVPRFDLLKLEKYTTVSLQFSRGCPFRCEFCDIIVMFGRKPRTKALEQVGRELDLLRTLGAQNVFFVDDNLIGNKRLAKNLLQYLREYQDLHNHHFNFGTEASLNLAQDQELLTLFRRANFEWVFIGIESPDEESLKETLKFQNIREDLLTSIRKIYASGLQIMAGFIVGFDHDTLKTFDKQFEFITQSGIQASMVALLTALPKTPLYERLEKAGRLRLEDEFKDNTRLNTNIQPMNMSYEQLIEGYKKLYFRLQEPRNIAERIKHKIRYLRNPIYQGGYNAKQMFGILIKFLTRGLGQGGISTIYHFMRSIPYSRPALITVVVQDWVIGLSMRNYIDRQFINEFRLSNEVSHGYFQTIEQVFKRYLNHGSLELSFEQVKQSAANLSISLKGWMDKDFYKLASHHLEKVLKETTSSITLNIHELQEEQGENLERLLKKLSRYGDRIHIVIHDKLKHLIEVDSSIFNVTMNLHAS